MNDSEVQLVSGHLSSDELAAIAVAVSAVSALSRAEAHERELMDRSGAPRSGWNAAYQRIPSAHLLRAQPGQEAWAFSHR